MPAWRITLVLFGAATALHSFPSEERGSISLGISAPVSLRYNSSSDEIYSAAGETLSVIDLKTFSLASTEPYDISADDTLAGTIKGLALDGDRDALYATQEGGALLVYLLSDLSRAPTRYLLNSLISLTFVEVDTATGIVYIYDETNRVVITFNPATEATGTIALNSGGTLSFTVNAMRFVPTESGGGTLVLTTTASRAFLIDAGSGLAQPVVLDTLSATNSIKGIAALADGSQIYLVNASDSAVQVVSAAGLSLLATIDLSANSNLGSIEIADVTNPVGTYAFVSGSEGLSVIDTADYSVLDLGDDDSVDDEPLPLNVTGPMVISEQNDLLLSTGNLTVVSDNPFVTVASVEYSAGSTLGAGGSVTVTFSADEAGTYALRVGGTLDADGTLLTDSAGATSGTAAADTDIAVVINYDANSSALAEGSNTIFLFVEDAEGNVGHATATITVDTPPDSATILSTGFGNGRGYVTVERLAASDISSYRAFVSTDAAEILSTDTVSASTGQTESGNPTIVISGLTNGTTYFVAVDAIDANGNASAVRTTTVSGAAATVSPQITAGPAGFAGEGGCSLITDPGARPRRGAAR